MRRGCHGPIVFCAITWRYAMDCHREKRRVVLIAVLMSALVVAVLAFIVTAAAKVGDNPALNAKIDFGVALASGLLAVVAIVVTVVMSGPLMGAADRLMESAGEFTDAKGEILRAVHDLDEKVSKRIDDEFSDPRDEVAATVGAPAASSAPGPAFDNTNATFVDDFLKKSKFEGLECLYALLQRKNKEPIPSKAIVASRGAHFYGFFYGFVIAARAVGLVKFTATGGQWTVTWVHPRIEATIKDCIRDRLGRQRIEPFKALNEMLGVEWRESDWLR